MSGDDGYSDGEDEYWEGEFGGYGKDEYGEGEFGEDDFFRGVVWEIALSSALLRDGKVAVGGFTCSSRLLVLVAVRLGLGEWRICFSASLLADESRMKQGIGMPEFLFSVFVQVWSHESAGGKKRCLQIWCLLQALIVK